MTDLSCSCCVQGMGLPWQKKSHGDLCSSREYKSLRGLNKQLADAVRKSVLQTSILFTSFNVFDYFCNHNDEKHLTLMQGTKPPVCTMHKETVHLVPLWVKGKTRSAAYSSKIIR